MFAGQINSFINRYRSTKNPCTPDHNVELFMVIKFAAPWQPVEATCLLLNQQNITRSEVCPFWAGVVEGGLYPFYRLETKRFKAPHGQYVTRSQDLQVTMQGKNAVFQLGKSILNSYVSEKQKFIVLSTQRSVHDCFIHNRQKLEAIQMFNQ